jgi:multiple sugar transport system permease protein
MSARPRGMTLQSRKSLIGLSFALLCCIPLLVFFLYPLLWAFRTSLYDTGVGETGVFVGWDNYLGLLRDSSLWNSLRVTLQLTALVVGVEMVLGFVLALSLQVRSRMVTVMRTIFLVPLIMPSVATSTIWYYMFESNYGVINSVLSALGLMHKKFPLLFNRETVLYAIALVSLSAVVYLSMLMLSAGLQTIPEELYEAAAIDGANAWQRLRHVTLPLMVPTISFVAVFRTMDMLQIFGVIYILTKGGPSFASESLVVNLYRQAFIENKLGYASAMSFLIFALILVFVVLYARLSQRYEA